MNIKISACTITKNEEKNIARSIESYKNYVDEIIIVDTGSTDNTVEIAKSLGAKVIEFKWINDFAAAKNCALDVAKGDWILFLDADEWIKDNGAMKLQNIIQRAIKVGVDSVSFRMYNLSDEGTVTDTNSSLRLFEATFTIDEDYPIVGFTDKNYSAAQWFTASYNRKKNDWSYLQ
jgi:glycosyltransferase involved in cell wall biosynthesis